MSSDRQRILIADANTEATRRLAAALRARGHQVLTVANGSKALEVAVMRAPEVVVYDAGCPLIDASTFGDILRANPRTASIPLLVMGDKREGPRSRSGFQAAYVQKPFNVDEVLSRIRELVQRAEAANEARSEGELEGKLSQLPLSDLIQMLAINRRSGSLWIQPKVESEPAGSVTACIYLSEGRVVEAQSGAVRGTKAFYRLLKLEEGSFKLEPKLPKVEHRITDSIEELLLEGMRQCDEFAAIRPQLPAPEADLALVVDPEHLPDGLHPVTKEVLSLINTYRRVQEVIDRCSSPDLEVARALLTLIDRGLVRVLGRVSKEQGRSLVSEGVLLSLLTRYARRHSRGRGLDLDLALVLGGMRPFLSIAGGLTQLRGWRPAPDLEARSLPIGELGVLLLGDSLRLRLVGVPALEAYAPMWRLLAGDAVGVLLVGGTGAETKILHEMLPLLRENRRPVVALGVADSSLLERLGNGTEASAATDPLAGLATLIQHLARGPVAGARPSADSP